ncbi:MAG: hypothetical protein HYV07_33655 [Deltaproteobacteria bacterium]|nr:hypothetical protein [Deltaproteobacteria bacterium]
MELIALMGRRGVDISAFPAALMALGRSLLETRPAPRHGCFREFAKDRPLRAPMVDATINSGAKKASDLMYGAVARYRA